MNSRNKKQTTSTGKGQIRIIAGQYRGRKLPVLMAEGLRPTTDRVKETVFNWLMPYIQNALCLDCFAGSGSLGFEAISRGAQHATLLELNNAAAKQLKQNAQLLNAENINIKQVDSLAFLNSSTPVDLDTQPFDLVFLDPPFNKQLVEKSALLLNEGWLAPNALVYVEMESHSNHKNNQQSIPNNWRLLKEKTAGQVAYQLYQVD